MSKIPPARARKQRRIAQSSPLSEKPTDEQLVKATTYQEDLLNKIDSPNEEERHWAIASLARLVTEEPQIFTLVAERTDVISRTVKRVFDPESTVRVTASGLLRNLSATGDVTVCKKIVASDCLTSLFTVIKQFHESTLSTPTPTSTQGPPGAEDAEEDDNKEQEENQQALVVNSLAILTSLSEVDEYVLDKILKSNLMNVFFELLKPARIEVAIASAELLHVVTDDYPPSKSHISDHSIMLLKATTANMKSELYLRILAAGILFNVGGYSWEDQSWSSLVVKAIIPSLAQSLDIDTATYFASLLTKIPNAEYPINLLLEDNPDGQTLFDLKVAKTSLTTQITAIEILTNLLITNNNGDSTNSMQTSEQQSEHLFISDIPNNVLTQIIHQQIFHKVLLKCEVIPSAEINHSSNSSSNSSNSTITTTATPNPTLILSTLSQIKYIIPHLKLFYERQSRALSLINNMLLVFPLNAVSRSSQEVQHLWNNFFGLCSTLFSSTNTSSNLLDASTLSDQQRTITSILYGVVRSLANSKPNGFIALDEWQVSALFQLIKFPSDEHVRANSLGTLTILFKFGGIKGDKLNEYALNFGKGVLECLSDSSGWVIVEALDAIFTFFDDNFPEVVQKINLLPTLTTFRPFLERKLKEGRGNIDEILYEKLDEALANIDPFLEYKRAQKRS